MQDKFLKYYNNTILNQDLHDLYTIKYKIAIISKKLKKYN